MLQKISGVFFGLYSLIFAISNLVFVFWGVLPPFLLGLVAVFISVHVYRGNKLLTALALLMMSWAFILTSWFSYISFRLDEYGGPGRLGGGVYDDAFSVLYLVILISLGLGVGLLTFSLVSIFRNPELVKSKSSILASVTCCLVVIILTAWSSVNNFIIADGFLEDEYQDYKSLDMLNEGENLRDYWIRVSE